MAHHIGHGTGHATLWLGCEHHYFEKYGSMHACLCTLDQTAHMTMVNLAISVVIPPPHQAWDCPRFEHSSR